MVLLAFQQVISRAGGHDAFGVGVIFVLDISLEEMHKSCGKSRFIIAQYLFCATKQCSRNPVTPCVSEKCTVNFFWLHLVKWKFIVKMLCVVLFVKLKAEKEGDVTTLVEDSCIYGSWNPWPHLLYECRWSPHHHLLLIVPRYSTQRKLGTTLSLCFPAYRLQYYPDM